MSEFRSMSTQGEKTQQLAVVRLAQAGGQHNVTL